MSLHHVTNLRGLQGPEGPQGPALPTTGWQSALPYLVTPRWESTRLDYKKSGDRVRIVGSVTTGETYTPTSTNVLLTGLPSELRPYISGQNQQVGTLAYTNGINTSILVLWQAGPVRFISTIHNMPPGTGLWLSLEYSTSNDTMPAV